MKRIIISLLVSLLLSVPAFPESPAFQSTTANITTWNLSGFTPIPREKATTFARAITYLDPEVLQ